MKENSKKVYLRAFGQLRDFIGEDFSTRPPSEPEMLRYFDHLRKDKGMASSSLWTVFSMINGMCRGKYSFNLKQYGRLTSRLRRYDTDVKTKTDIFSPAEINRFVLAPEPSTPYWLVRKVTVCLAYYGGLRLVEVLKLSIEMCESTPEGVYVSHVRVTPRSDQINSR